MDSPIKCCDNFLEIKLHRITNLPPNWVSIENGIPPMYTDHPFRYDIDVVFPPPPLSQLNTPRLTHRGSATGLHSVSSERGSARASLASVGNNSPRGGRGKGISWPATPTVGYTGEPLEGALTGVPPKFRFTNGRLLERIPLYSDFIKDANLPVEVKEDEIPDVPCIPGPPPPRPPGDTQVVVPIVGVSEEPPAILFVLTPEAEADELMEEVPVSKKDARYKKGAPPPVRKSEFIHPTEPLSDQAPSCMIRIPLVKESLDSLESLMANEQPLVLLFRRRLKKNCPTEWEDTQEQRYQARISVPLTPLLVPGATGFDVEVKLDPIHPGVKEDEKGKKKPVTKKGKINIPVLLTEEPEPGDNHPYRTHQTTASLSISCHKAVTRLPQSRPVPNLKPSDLIPRRVRPPHRPLEASKHFTNGVGSIAQRIVQEYRDHARAVNLEGEEARNSFLSYLREGGHIIAYQQLLTPLVQEVAKERFPKNHQPTKGELELTINDLYSLLLEHLHVAMNKVFGGKSQTINSLALDGDDSSRWKRLAEEAEMMNDIPMAIRYYHERLRDPKDETLLPDIWCDYAEFSLRIRDGLRAEQAYKEAIALNPSHVSSLMGYGLLLLSRNRVREAEVFIQSAADVDGSMLTWGAVALLFDVLSVTIADESSNTDMVEFYKREHSNAVAQSIRCEAHQASYTSNEVYYVIGEHLCRLHLEDLANLALVNTYTDTFDVDYLYATIFYQTEQYSEGALVLRQWLDKRVLSQSQDCHARLLLGDIHVAWDKLTEAETFYDAALRIDPNAASTKSLLWLGNIYVGLGKYKDALSTFLVSAKQHPSGLTWLGVGISYYRLEDMGRAEQALNESNMLNNLNSKTWGYLTLLCLRQQREEDAECTYNQAVKLGISDPDLIAEIGVRVLPQW